jgi:endonuclease/exonuclease/phosphatase family metal-dependent hydrolase
MASVTRRPASALVPVLLLLLALGSAPAAGDGPAPEGARRAATGKGVRVRVASYNVWGLPLGFSRDLAGRLRRLPAALRALEPEVIALQEVWPGTGARAALAEGLAEDFAAAKSDRGGLMVLSRWPILEERFTPYPLPPEVSPVELLAGKGVLEVVVKTPGGPLRVVTTHMVAFDSKVREQGIPVLAEVLEARPDLPLVAAGDFNVRRVSGRRGALTPAYRRLLATGCEDCAPPQAVEEGVYTELPNSHVGWPRDADDVGWWRPDHVLHRSAPKAALRLVEARMALDTPETALSDHNLMLVTLRLRRR